MRLSELRQKPIQPQHQHLLLEEYLINNVDMPATYISDRANSREARHEIPEPSPRPREPLRSSRKHGMSAPGLLGRRKMSDLSPQSGPKRTLDWVAFNRDFMSTHP